MQEIYRSAASVLVLRRKGDTIELLLLHKPRKRDAWQLPQGGVEQGEITEQAALRELKEEAGLEARVIGASKSVYQYDFPASFRRFRPDNVKGQRIEYIFALAEPDAAVQVDQKEIIGFQWVRAEDLPRHIQRKQYLSLVKALYDEAVGLL